MKRMVLAALVGLGGMAAQPTGPLPYDSTATKELMHDNVAAVSAVNTSVTSGDWIGVANGFLVFVQNAQKALKYAPPKGDAQEWTRLWQDVLFAAYRGVGAAGEKDAAKVKTALDQIIGDRNAGHPKFKG